MDIFDLKGNLKGKIDDGRAFDISPNGQLVACRSGQTIAFRFEPTGPVVSSIATHNFPKWYQFLPDSKRLAVLFADQVAIFDVLTSQKVFMIKRTTHGAFSRLKVINENTLIFDDINRVICFCDIEQQTVIAETKPFQGIKNVNKGRPWAFIGEKLILQENNCDLSIYESIKSKFLGCEDFFQNHPLSVCSDKNLYINGVVGLVGESLRPYSAVYEHALAKQDFDVFKRGIYPYQVNALHYFVMKKNALAIQLCFKIGVPFLKDVFGQTPLDYAL